ncbi:MAG TPA: hypothetical protein VN371_06200 [Chlorobaculum sp.]|nr:hypothetical protein [Chlorobaculum sp.]
MGIKVSRSIPKIIFLVLLPLFLFLSTSSSYSAEIKNVTASDKKQKAPADSIVPAKLSYRVVEVTNSRPKYKDRAGLDDKISVKVDNLGELMKQVGGDINKIELKINDKVLSDLRPLRKVDDNTLEFQLVKNEKTKVVWDSLAHGSSLIVMPVTVSLVLDKQATNHKVDIWGGNFKLILRNDIINSWLFVGGLVLFGFSFLQIGGLDARLRNFGPKSPYSLALVQMAIWYYVVTMSFIYLTFTSGGLPELNNSTMILLGISSATAVGAKVIDSANIDKSKSDAADKGGKDSAQVAKDGDALSIKLEEWKSKGFLYDILSDEYGIALSRFQIFVWTIIMVLIFVYYVVTEKTVPDFTDSNLLLLMGISSGSYAGYKLKENYTKKVNG